MPIPNADPLGLPAPAWLLQVLLVLTFFLHLLPMGITLGGSVLAAVAEGQGRFKGDDHLARLARHLAKLLPTVTAFTVTLGVAPLLFVQLLYGQFFYSSTVLMGWWWLGVVALLLVGYSLLYLNAWKGGSLGTRRLWAAGGALVCLVLVAFIYTNVMSLMAAPERWLAMYEANPYGTSLNTAEPFLLPRFLHVALWALTLTATYIIAHGFFAADAGYGQAARRFGKVWLTASLALQLPVSLWYYAVLPKYARAGLFAEGLLLTIIAPIAVGLGYYWLYRSRNKTQVLGGVTAVAVASALLAISRHLVRNRELVPYIQPAHWQLNSQLTMLLLFVVTLLVSLAVIFYLIYRFRQDQAAPPVPTGGLPKFTIPR